MYKPRNDLSGKKFGKLTVSKFVGNSKWLCLCDCGNEATVLTANLNRNNTKSCGCIKKITTSKRATTHGLSGTKVYRCWLNIKRRCFEVNYPSYKDYGAKGITMYEPWAKDLTKFVEHIGHAPSEEHSVDRIDNSKGYEPGNVRWADKWEQANNKSNNVKVTFQGMEFSSISVFARWIASQCDLSEHEFKREFQRAIYGERK